jgi:hypothetical protein
MCDHHTFFSSALTALSFAPIYLTAGEDQLANEFSDKDFPRFLFRSMIVEAHKVPGGLEGLGEDLT